eukprot:CAMPEP_0196997434 /NCGR_PEP_ID=MMETSP1380-20130617/3045_1 /TAXON_ID=5936 /ORGANISM="Euplotes crassus, Strain CT5" /LENGTH=440 /DNA_ID=CAMNT_0042413665 /DNA_START=122 /DNA_END=1444 /DNA_ORIENTATION=-
MVWHKDHINGFEVMYGKNSAGVRGGKDYQNSPCQIVSLGSSEFITCVAGSQTEAIDELIFYTNKGNIFKTGVNKGGMPFTLSQGGDKFVVYFSIGMSEYMTYIKAEFRPLPAMFGRNTAPFCHINNMVVHQRAVYPPVENRLSQNAPIAQSQNTQGPQRPASIAAQANVEVSSPEIKVESGKLNSGKISDTLPEKLFYPSINNEREVQSEGDNSDEESKFDRLNDEMSITSSARNSLAGPAKMHGGLIPVISQVSEGQTPEVASQRAAIPSQANQQTLARNVRLVCYKSNVAGKVYSNTVMFDDYETLIKECLNAYMYEVRIMHDSDFIYGMQGFYQVDDKIVKGPAHFGNQVHTRCQCHSLKLQYGECIVSITGNYQEVINGLIITTSLGKVYAFGNYTSRCDTSKCTTFSLVIPKGKRAVALAGGASGYLNNISVHYT